MSAAGTPQSANSAPRGAAQRPNGSMRPQAWGDHTSALDAIAVKIVHGSGGVSGNATALMNELEKLLDAFVQRGEVASVDLRSLPLTARDHDELREALGVGAVVVRVDAIGPSDARETRYPGVWWVTHFDDAGSVVAELIEITPVPQIVVAPMEDVAAGLARLRDDLAGERARARPAEAPQTPAP
jgi:hydrogenase-1 operon protein HyaF